MPIGFHCSCGRPLSAADGRSGCVFHCPACGRLVEVPEVGAPGSHSLEAGVPTDFTGILPSKERSMRKINMHSNMWSLILGIILVLSSLALITTPFAGEAALCFTVSVAGLGVIRAIRDAAPSVPGSSASARGG
jgi:hypothetical protein